MKFKIQLQNIFWKLESPSKGCQARGGASPLYLKLLDEPSLSQIKAQASRQTLVEPEPEPNLISLYHTLSVGLARLDPN